MPQKAFSAFYTHIPHHVPDRDGYDQEAFSTCVLLRFYEDKSVDAVECEGFDDASLAGPAHFEGVWREDEAKTIRFNLSRTLPPDVVELEVPGDGSDYYAYPATGALSYLEGGEYLAVCVAEELHLKATDRVVLRLHGDVHSSLPCYQRTPRSLNLDGKWATFSSRDTETLQYNPDDDPREVPDNLHLRLHEDGSVRVREGTDEVDDLLPWKSEALTGQWAPDPVTGTIRITVERSSERRSHEWWREMNPGSYEGAVSGSWLYLDRGLAEGGHAAGILPWGEFLGSTLPGWLPQATDIPRPIEEEEVTGPIESGEERVEGHAGDGAPDSPDEDSTDDGAEMTPGCTGCLGSVVLIVLALGIGKFLAGGATLANDDFMQLVPGGEHPLGIVLDGTAAYKGYHTVSSFTWRYEPLEGEVVPLEIDVDNTAPWEVAEDDVVLLGPGNIPAPGQREDVVLDFVFRPGASAVVGSRGVLYLDIDYEYATWETGQVMASGVVGGDVDIFGEPATVDDHPVNVEVVVERQSTVDVWQRVSDWMARIGILGAALFGLMIVRETWTEMREKEA
jgi:hypothetical protein